ncbi:MAG TPA: glycosyltransferase family 39 protein [Burkholderiaceae bacterium]|nr:glycosyltransferase family 39 protein [Burkholderiaceae bacterium]
MSLALTPAAPRDAAPACAGAWLITGLVLVYALRLGIVAASGASLYVDEAQYWHWSRELHWGYYSKPPMIALLIAASTALFGDGVLGVKALAMACYPATALALHRLGCEMSGPRAGLIAALLFIASPLAGILGLAATTDGPLLLAWSLALWALWRAVSGGSLHAWLAFGVLLGLGLYSKYTMAALLPTAALLVAVTAHDRARAWRGLLLAVLVAVPMLLPHLAWNAAQGWPTLQHTAQITADVSRDPGHGAWRSLAEFVLGQALVLGPPLVLLALTWSWRARDAAMTPPLRFSLCAGAPLLALGLLQALHAKAQLNWVAPAHLGLLLAIALCADASARRARAAALAAALQLALLTLLTAAPLPASLDLWARMRGWQPGFASLHDAASHHRGGVVVGTDRTVIAQAAYHWRDLDLRFVAFNPGGGVHHHYELTSRWPPQLAAGTPLLLLSGGAWPPGLCEPFASVSALGHYRGAVELRLAQARAGSGDGRACP